MLIDSAKIYVKAGDGGNGIVSFHREKYVAAGGPDGGDGGKGGDVILVVDEGLRTLIDFKYKRKYSAQPGEKGGASNCSGKSGEDLSIKVPPGTLVKDADSGRILADLTKPGQICVIVKGGKGGAGNQHFATPTRQVPSFAKSGDPGEEKNLILELKMLADVGLVGFPNAGKSTLLSMISAARPKIAGYPFTTLEPHLGVVNLEGVTSFVVADIPGLIEGAHEGIGLGHEFLKHIERTKLLIHVVDVASVDGRDPLLDFETINRELELFNPKLALRPQVVAANKTDLPEGRDALAIFKDALAKKGCRVFPISAATTEGVNDLMLYVAELLSKLPETTLLEPSESEMVYEAREEEPFSIRKENNEYIVDGNWVKKLVNSTNFGIYESLQYFQRAIRSKGIIDELERLGINEGDTVKMYDFEFEYYR